MSVQVIAAAVFSCTFAIVEFGMKSELEEK